ncbi:hypothetical protein MTR_4g109320 [Medicago truncatula]|uniref:Uncharacterized protein n=1 Tax=Medicago truncatula TaxID=3880 RepID=A0A072USF1_MEDTR|nr:hypothetical protein MTR_4g109320 [Medicago truncatula]
MDAFANYNPCQRIAVQISGIGFVKHFTRVIKENVRSSAPRLVPGQSLSRKPEFAAEHGQTREELF